MRKSIAYYAAAAALLLVGAGCDSSVKQETSVDSPEGEESMIKVDGSVDGAVDLILEGAEEEKMNETESESEKDADEVTSDKASLNAYSESSYEIK